MNKKGFTLVELIVSIVLVSVVMVSIHIQPTNMVNHSPLSLRKIQRLLRLLVNLLIATPDVLW